MTNTIDATTANDDDQPLDIRALAEAAPWWPFGPDATYRLVRKQSLSAIAIGRRRFVTRRLLRECLSRHTV